MFPERARVRDLFLRLLGGIHLVAFLSLWSQVSVLMGSRGLIPAAEWLPRQSFADTPSIFHLGASDAALHAFALVGVLASVALVLGLAPRLVLVVLWALSLSFTVAGSAFFEFQWDTLLLEATYVAWFVAPWGWRPRNAPGPGPVAQALVLALVVKLHMESGVSKLWSGDPSWRDLSAMASYYETAPLPTRLGWWAHQLPVPVHQATSLVVLVAEILLPALVIGPHRVRGALFLAFATLQVVVGLTANYGFFNWLTVVLCLFVLDDGHLTRRPAHPVESKGRPRREVLPILGLTIFGLLSIPAFVSSLFPGNKLNERVLDVYEPYRTINAYRLFANMTLVRREVVIEGSLDGETWEPYELHYKPGDPLRAPPFVAPHQPRVDFLLWFARLGGRRGPIYLERLVERLLEDPDAVAPLFAHMPFEGRAPVHVRVATYEYRFTDLATARETGAWWERVRLPRETSEVMTRPR